MSYISHRTLERRTFNNIHLLYSGETFKYILKTSVTIWPLDVQCIVQSYIAVGSMKMIDNKTQSPELYHFHLLKVS